MARDRDVTQSIKSRCAQVQDWKHQSEEVLQQANGSDCSIHTIANALALISNRPLPTKIDGSALRFEYAQQILVAAYENSENIIGGRSARRYIFRQR